MIEPDPLPPLEPEPELNPVAVTVQVAEYAPFWVFAVITAEPFDFAVTFPYASTAATLALELDQTTVLFAASAGNTVAVN